MNLLLRFGAIPGALSGLFIALPVFTLAARLPDTPLTSALHVVVGGTLVWLALSVHPERIPDGPARQIHHRASPLRT
jgi:hypothetical protein